MEVQIPSPIDVSINSNTTLVSIMSDDSSKVSACSEASDSREDIYTHKGRYVEEDESMNFFCNLVPESIVSLEAIVIFTTNLDALK